MNYKSWIQDMREIRQDEDSPLQLKNGVWKIHERQTLWSELSQRIFDEHLEHIKNFAVKILTEIEPQFELPVDERFGLQPASTVKI